MNQYKKYGWVLFLIIGVIGFHAFTARASELSDAQNDRAKLEAELAQLERDRTKTKRT